MCMYLYRYVSTFRKDILKTLQFYKDAFLSEKLSLYLLFKHFKCIKFKINNPDADKRTVGI